MRESQTKTLVVAETEDGLELNGYLIQPGERLASLAIIWIHGFGANFYFAPYLRLGEALADRGCTILIGNTRGHDFGTLLEPKGRTPYFGGAAWERLAESAYDMAAWIECAARLSYSDIAL